MILKPNDNQELTGKAMYEKNKRVGNKWSDSGRMIKRKMGCW